MTTPLLGVCDVGDRRNVVAALSGSGGSVDATAATFTVRPPDDVAVVYVFGTAAEITRTAVGRYVLTLTFDQAGEWGVTFAATGFVVLAGSGTVTVRDPAT